MRRRDGGSRFVVEDFLARFWQKVDVRGPEDCWLWTGARHYKGYGEFVVLPRRKMKASQVSWILANAADIPPGLLACHSCDNPPCVNPAHLFLGTNHENILDSVAKGRRAKTRAWALFCVHGHRRSASNIYIRKEGHIQCKECTRQSGRRRYA